MGTRAARLLRAHDEGRPKAAALVLETMEVDPTDGGDTLVTNPPGQRSALGRRASHRVSRPRTR